MFQLFGARTPGGAMTYRLVIIERALDLILKALSVEYREDLTDQLANLVAACQKIEAIKLYRAQIGSTLEAKDAVEAMADSGCRRSIGSTPSAGRPASGSDATMEPMPQPPGAQQCPSWCRPMSPTHYAWPRNLGPHAGTRSSKAESAMSSCCTAAGDHSKKTFS